MSVQLVFNNGYRLYQGTCFKTHIATQLARREKPFIPIRIGNFAVYMDDKNRIWRRPLG